MNRIYTLIFEKRSSSSNNLNVNYYIAKHRPCIQLHGLFIVLLREHRLTK